MKKFKINLSVLVLLFVAATAFAFNVPEKQVETANAVQWFSYNGMGEDDPDNYTELLGVPECEGSVDLCAIEAPEDGSSGKPTQAGVEDPISIRQFD